jgi:c(7)-type cytochrome triheme protein
VLLVGLLVLCLSWPALAYFRLPRLPSPDKYGDVVMDRVASAKGEKAVVFSHWSHRVRYSCRVCHYELNFEMAAGQTEFSEEENRDGEFCGACHDGTLVFGHTEEHCEKCHTGPSVDRRSLFATLQDKLRRLPRTGFGNRIDWGLALRTGQIAPRYSLFKAEEKPMAFDKRLVLAAEWNWVPPAIFDHATHVPWLDCSNCHPDIFNIKKKTTKHFSMEYILEKKFCGVCHFSVALPMDDCQACHPGMSRSN